MDAFTRTVPRRAMRYRITACRDCNDRKVGCHATCERYLADRQRYEAEKQQIITERKKDLNQIGRTREGIERMKKGKRH